MNSHPQNPRQPADLPEGEIRERCYGCFRPVSQCYCDAIPRIQNKTEVLILQHKRERDHPFNTARMVRAGLLNSRLLSAKNSVLATMDLKLGDGCGLIYPSRDAKVLTDLSPSERPKQIVLLDGTWPQARTMVRDIPVLQNLPCYKLAPTEPGKYRIRLEPDDVSLSTVEAAVEALRELEPETEGLDQLILAFHKMVQNQLDHPEVGSQHYSGGPRSGLTMNIPRRLLGPASRIIVAYGEAAYRSPNEHDNRHTPRPPLFWVAKRLAPLGVKPCVDSDPFEISQSVAGENENENEPLFAAAIKPHVPMTDTFLDHLELTQATFDHALPISEFRDRWNQFIRDDDVLAVYNQGTVRLLESVNCNVGYPVTLKSINFLDSGKRSSINAVLARENLQGNPPREEYGRAGRRLEKAIVLIKFLRMKNRL
ncbi:MAG: tRNA-uridine aminocarboxypropyltransferase [Mariniblastus sp.]